MTNSVAKDIATLLVANGLGVLGTSLFAEEFGPDTIDVQTVVISTGGINPEDKQAHEHLTFQVLCRGARNASSSSVYTMEKNIYDLLVALPEQNTINSTNYLGFEPVSNIASLGRDENDRFVYTMNYSTYRDF